MHVTFIASCHGITMVTCTEECGNLRWEKHHEEIVVAVGVVDLPAPKTFTTTQKQSKLMQGRDITYYLGNKEERHEQHSKMN